MSNIEEQIRKAMEAGKFADLPGKGKPLRLEDNPFVDPEWRLAYHVLRSSGFSLPWIERRREIEGELDAARQALRHSWEWREANLSLDGSSSAFVEAEWSKACAVFRERIADLNTHIRSYNLEAPSERFHLRIISAERELELTTANPSDTLSGIHPK
jgi:DnaJ family protein C protein 28